MTDQPWHQHPDVWKAAHAHIDPALREFITLSPIEVMEFTEEAIKAPDPAAKLAELLNRKGEAKRAALDLQKQARMTQDAQKLLDPSTWPNPERIALKTQPWQNQGGQQMRFAVYYALKPLIVFSENDGKIPYASIAELVDMWSVD